MRRFMPARTWLVADPVWTATHDHGCAVPHSVVGEPGHALPVLRAYCGAQPPASSSLSWLTFGSQSSDWFWLPPITRRATTGSLTEAALARLPLTPIRTTRLCVQLIWTELQRSRAFAHWTPFSHTSAARIGPERTSSAANARCTEPKDPLHLLPPDVLQELPFSVPLVSAQSIETTIGPAAGATGIVVAELQRFATAS